MNNAFSITVTTKRRPPQVPFADIKNSIVGTRYAVSLVFVGKVRAQALNRLWRNKSYVPNVLACEVSPELGEIYICPEIARKEARAYGHTERSHIGFLFIHALLHLKGHAHGDTMEKAESRFMKKFDLA